jgi:hypothetical protein
MGAILNELALSKLRAYGLGFLTFSDDGQPVHSFRTLLANLATLTRNTVRCGKAEAITMLARPTQIQQRALELLGVKLQL